MSDSNHTPTSNARSVLDSKKVMIDSLGLHPPGSTLAEERVRLSAVSENAP